MEQGSKPVERRRPSLSTYITYLLGNGSSNQLKTGSSGRGVRAPSPTSGGTSTRSTATTFRTMHIVRCVASSPERSRCGLRSSPPASYFTTLSGGRSAGGSASRR
jgi:hypothetical protein